MHDPLREALQSLYDVVIEQNRLGASWHPSVFDKLMPALVNARAALQQAPAQEPPKFPTMLRKMWSGSEVQEWIDRNWK